MTGIDGQLATGEPKSKKGRRTIALPALAREGLQRHRITQAKERLAAGDSWIDDDFVFATLFGRPVEPGNFLRSWHALLARTGLDRRPLHEARHAAASLMLSKGAPLKAAQETLGHSTIRLTADLYGHLMPGDADRVAWVVDDAFGA